MGVLAGCVGGAVALLVFLVFILGLREALDLLGQRSARIV